MNHLAILSLIGLFVVPFLVPYHTAPLPSFYSEWSAAILGLLAFLSSLAKRNADGSIAVPRIVLLPIGLMLLLLLQFAFADQKVDRELISLAVLYLLLGALVMVTARSLLKDIGIAKISTVLSWAAVAGGVVSAILAIFQQWDMGVQSSLVAAKISVNAYGNLAQSNHLAAQLGIALGALLGLVSCRRLPWLPGFLLAVILLLALTLSGARSGWLYMVTLLVLAFAYRVKFGTEQGRRLVVATVISAVLFICIQQIIGAADMKAEVESAPGKKTVVVDVSTASERLSTSRDMLGVRGPLWRGAWHMFAAHPLQGIGFGQYSWHFFQLEADSARSVFWKAENHAWNNCHNLPLQLLAEFGIGAGILLAVFAYWLYRTYRHARSPESVALVAMLTIIMVHSLVEYPLYYSYFLLPAATLMSLADTDAWQIRLQGSLRLGLLAVCAIYGGLVVNRLWGDYRNLEAIHYASKQHPGAFGERDLLTLADIQTQSLLSLQADALLNRIGISVERPSTWLPLLHVSERAMRYETAAPSVYRHILLLALNGEADQARALLSQARHVYPDFFDGFRIRITNLGQANPGIPQLHLLIESLNAPSVG